MKRQPSSAGRPQHQKRRCERHEEHQDRHHPQRNGYRIFPRRRTPSRAPGISATRTVVSGIAAVASRGRLSSSANVFNHQLNVVQYRCSRHSLFPFSTLTLNAVLPAAPAQGAAVQNLRLRLARPVHKLREKPPALPRENFLSAVAKPPTTPASSPATDSSRPLCLRAASSRKNSQKIKSAPKPSRRSPRQSPFAALETARHRGLQSSAPATPASASS